MDKKLRTVKSYVLRAGRMSPAQESAYNRLFNKYSYTFSDKFLRKEDNLLKNELIIEIGFGMGDATYQIAMENPGQNFLGIEVYKPGIGKLLGHIEQNNIQNLKIIEYDAVDVLKYMIPDNSIAGFHIFFPDPWPKKKHHKRRIIKSDFVSLMKDKIVKGGYIYTVTDWENYADQMLSVFENEKKLMNKYSGFAEPQEWRPFTKFERKGKDKSHRIFELVYIKKEEDVEN